MVTDFGRVKSIKGIYNFREVKIWKSRMALNPSNGVWGEGPVALQFSVITTPNLASTKPFIIYLYQKEKKSHEHD